MSQLSYTTGNPNNLVGGGNASMNDVQGPFVDVRSFLNGGNLDETNVPNLSAAFTTYKSLMTVQDMVGSVGANLYYMWTGTPIGNVTTGSANSGAYTFWFDSTDYSANARTTKLRIRAMVLTNIVAPAINFAFEMRPITAFSAGGGLQPAIAVGGVGAAVGTGPTISSPGANAATQGVGSDFTAPAAGAYALCANTSGTAASNSLTVIKAWLQLRQT